MTSNIGKPTGTPLRFREMAATYVLKDGTQGDVRILNLTERGMGCACGPAPIAAGDEIGIALPFLGVRPGIVRWTKDGRFGIQMVQPLDTDCLRLYSNLDPADPS